MLNFYRIAPRICTLLIVLLLCGPVSAQVGRDWGTHATTYRDPVTDVEVSELTQSPSASENLYYHFSNFTADNRYVILSSTLAGERQLFRADVKTDRIVQLTAGAAVNPRAACPDHTHASRVYYLRGPLVFAIDVDDFTSRRIGEIPPPREAPYSQPTLSGDGRWITLSKRLNPENWEIGLMEVDTGSYRTVLTQGFPISHVQHSPTDPIIFYAWETGGFAPQRTWLVNVDGTGNRPFYARTDRKTWFTPLKEWVTHESWIRGTGEMTMINDRQGVMLVEKDGTARMVREGHYWHAAGSPDGKFLVLDDFDGRLWLMETATGNTRLLATELRASVKVHPHPSFDRNGDYVLFNTGRTHRTIAMIDLRKLPDLVWR